MVPNITIDSLNAGISENEENVTITSSNIDPDELFGRVQENCNVILGGSAQWGEDYCDDLILAGFEKVRDGVYRKPVIEKKMINLEAPKVWTLDMDDDDLIDDDELLEDEDLEPVEVEREEGEGKKACKNCTCGKKTAEEKKEALKKGVSPSCGSCGLGDAYRCSTCPFFGKPAFDMDEGVTFTVNDKGEVVIKG